MTIKGICFTIILAVIGVLSACGAGFGPGEIQSITISPSTPTLAPGNSQQLTATMNSAGSPPWNCNTCVIWTVSDTSIAAITKGGLFTAVATGTVIVKAVLLDNSIETQIVVTVT